ncbi:MAG: hypothetical protein KDB82_09235 [Planctomycetes bacterium]|nr:hypothetical protein [Planctomycetota bacterium]
MDENAQAVNQKGLTESSNLEDAVCEGVASVTADAAIEYFFGWLLEAL